MAASELLTNKHVLLLCGSVLLALIPASEVQIARGQKVIVHRCKGERAIKYKVEVGTRTVREPIQLLLQVGVEPEHFNREGMTRLANQINKDYCAEQGLYVAIYDDPKAVKKWHWSIDYTITEGKSKTGPLRGFYTLDRTTGEEKITFSTKRNNSLDEVVIVISQSKQD